MRKSLLIAAMMGLALVAVGCGKSNKTKTDVNNNEAGGQSTVDVSTEKKESEVIFTEEFDNALKIEVVNGDNILTIDNKEDVAKVIELLRGVDAVKEDVSVEDMKFGYKMFNIILEDRTIAVGILSQDMVVDDTHYKVANDITEQFNEIVEKNS